MATFLTLTNLLLERFNEVQLTTATFSAAGGIYGQCKSAVNAAILNIVRDYQKWPFLHQKFQAVTSPGVFQYSLSGVLNPTDWDTFTLLRDDSASPPVAQRSLNQRDYNDHRQYQAPLDAQADSTQWNQPNYVAQDLTGNGMEISPYPDQIYTLEYEAWVIPTFMVLAADTCVVPDQFNHVIIDKAMQYVFLFKENLDAFQASKDFIKGNEDGMMRQAIPKDPYMKIPLVNRSQPLVGPTRRW